MSFLNDAYGGSPALDRNLHVEAVSLNGTSAASETAQYGDRTYSMAGPITLYTTGDTASFLASGG